MTRNMYGAIAASFASLALALGPNAMAAGSGAGPRAAFAAPHPAGAGAFRHFHRHNGIFTYWPGYDDSGYGPSVGEPASPVAPPTSNDVHYTYTYDVPWDWAHRCRQWSRPPTTPTCRVAMTKPSPSPAEAAPSASSTSRGAIEPGAGRAWRSPKIQMVRPESTTAPPARERPLAVR